MGKRKSNAVITAELLLVVILWGGNNVAVKYQLGFWPPVFTASVRFLLAGWLLQTVMRHTDWLGRPTPIDNALGRRLWTHGATSLALYIMVFVWAVKLTSPSTVALFMGTSPVWALLLEERLNLTSAPRYAAAGLALAGVGVLFYPSAHGASTTLAGNLLALVGSILWTIYSRQCRTLGHSISGLELTGHTFWRAGALLIPVACWEVATRGVRWNPAAAWLQVYAVLFSGLLAFGLWNDALRSWPTSRAFLFGNLIPVTTMTFAHYFMGEPVTRSFWLALGLILSAVLLGQFAGKSGQNRSSPAESSS